MNAFRTFITHAEAIRRSPLVAGIYVPSVCLKHMTHAEAFLTGHVMRLIQNHDDRVMVLDEDLAALCHVSMSLVDKWKRQKDLLREYRIIIEDYIDPMPHSYYQNDLRTLR